MTISILFISNPLITIVKSSQLKANYQEKRHLLASTRDLDKNVLLFS
tara:strand:- start:267 stop:407 length:141 start_codon:yes stop_codon:yes gene_type:complete